MRPPRSLGSISVAPNWYEPVPLYVGVPSGAERRGGAAPLFPTADAIIKRLPPQSVTPVLGAGPSRTDQGRIHRLWPCVCCSGFVCLTAVHERNQLARPSANLSRAQPQRSQVCRRRIVALCRHYRDSLPWSAQHRTPPTSAHRSRKRWSNRATTHLQLCI